MLPAIFDVLGEDAKCVGTLVEKLVYHSNLEILQMDVVDGIAGITFQFIDGICAVYLTVFHVDVVDIGNPCFVGGYQVFPLIQHIGVYLEHASGADAFTVPHIYMV